MLKMNIRNKLYLAFGAMIALLVITSVIINVTSSRLSEANKVVIEQADFESQMKTFQKQHVDWINALSDHIFVGAEFSKTLNPRECGFGKWYYSYMESEEFKNEEPEKARLMKSLEEPHRHLHEGGASVIEEMNAGHKANAMKYYQENTIPVITKLDGIYSELVDNARDVIEKRKVDAATSESAQRTLVLLTTLFGILLGVAIAFFLSRNIVAAVQQMVTAIKNIARGDLSKKVELNRSDELGEMAHELNNMISDLSKLVGDVVVSSESVANAADQISAGNQELSQRTQEQASALEETAATIEEMASTIKQNAENARNANMLAKDASDLAQNGGQVVEETVASMGEVSDASKKIADIIDVVNEIAFQTNLLALNAAVEAARAGEQGKGFAVVAGEVRNLAQRSAEAAKEIQELIKDSVGKVDKGNKLVEESGKTLKSIIDSIHKVAETVSEISSASQEQATGIDQVNKAVTMMDDVVQQNASLVEESASASQSLALEAEELQKSMAFFIVTNDASLKREERTSGERKPRLTLINKAQQREPAKVRAKAAGAEDLDIETDEEFEEF